MSISPNVPNSQESYHYESAGTPRWIAVLFGLLFAAVAVVGYLGHQTETKLESDLSKQEDQNKVISAQLEQANTRLADLKGHLDVTEQKIGMTRAELAQASSRAEVIRKNQIDSDKKLTTELTQVQKESEEKIGAVATDVTGAKKDIEATKTDLEATKSKLDRTQGDMGVMSGLIARTHDDLEELKRRGDRNYYEFTVKKAKSPQRVGPIQVNVNKTDPKKSKFTMTVFADDKEIEKKDRTSGEPIQFYVGSSRLAPYEIVVFKIGKDELTGYLSTPKDGGASGAPAATPAKQ
jgi:septal ring factor EnvC (AmiA/AmiB activator)